VLLLAAARWRVAVNAPLFEQVDLFRAGDDGVHTYRIPALVETRKGTLLAVADARHESSRDMPARISLVMRRSADRGRTWSAVRTIRAVGEGGVGDGRGGADRVRTVRTGLGSRLDRVRSGRGTGRMRVSTPPEQPNGAGAPSRPRATPPGRISRERSQKERSDA
jgi:hypothetical protein